MQILTASFASSVHMAPYYSCTGFFKNWYEHHLTRREFTIHELRPHGYWYALLKQEITRLGALERTRDNWAWPLAYTYTLLSLVCFRLRAMRSAADLACFSWHVVAVKPS